MKKISVKFFSVITTLILLTLCFSSCDYGSDDSGSIPIIPVPVDTGFSGNFYLAEMTYNLDDETPTASSYFYLYKFERNGKVQVIENGYKYKTGGGLTDDISIECSYTYDKANASLSINYMGFERKGSIDSSGNMIIGSKTYTKTSASDFYIYTRAKYIKNKDGDLIEKSSTLNYFLMEDNKYTLRKWSTVDSNSSDSTETGTFTKSGSTVTFTSSSGTTTTGTITDGGSLTYEDTFYYHR